MEGPASSPPLRILQVNSLFNGGGADNQTLELALGLKERGAAVALSISAGCRWETLARRSGLRVEVFPPRSPLKLAMIGSWIRLIRRERIQIIHAHQGRDYWPAILAARLAGRGTKVVVTRHLMTRPRGLTRGLLLRLADVVAVSNAVLEVLRRELRGPRSRLHQVYCGIDTGRFQPDSPAAKGFRRQQGWDDDQVVFGVVGAFNLPNGKGQIEFLEAAAQVKPVYPQARFCVVGEGTMGSLLRDRVTALGLQAQVRFIPFTEEIAPVLGALDVLVHPAVGTEALALVLLEALASGKPVIASRLDGIPETFQEGEHGLLVPPGDVAVLAAGMRTLLQDPARRARLGAAGPAWVGRNFSREIQAGRVHELYLALGA